MSLILIADDEPQILRMLRASLMGSGYEVITAANGEEAYALFEQRSPDLVITDMSMPVMDGFALTEALRRVSDVPIIVLSVRATEPVKVNALDAGADDYVTKPFNMPELLARVRAHLRRETRTSAPEDGDLKAGEFAVNRATREVAVGGFSVHLTPKEFDLLCAFLQSPDKVLTHRSLSRSVWGQHSDTQPEKLRVLVAQLRRKIETPEKHYIQSEPWVGYTLRSAGVEPSI